MSQANLALPTPKMSLVNMCHVTWVIIVSIKCQHLTEVGHDQVALKEEMTQQGD